MARSESVVLTNMCMVTDGTGNVLVQDRNDPRWPGLTFPGGHVEIGESFVQSVIREVQEETGLTVADPDLCGIKQFYTLDGVRYIVLLYRTDRFSGELRDSKEGRAFWLPLAEFDNYKWVPDFKDIRRIYQDEDFSELFYFREDSVLKHMFY